MKKSISVYFMIIVTLLFFTKGVIFLLFPESFKELYINQTVMTGPKVEHVFNELRFILSFNNFMIGSFMLMILVFSRKYVKIALLLVVIIQFLLVGFNYLGNNLDSLSIQMIESLLIVFLGIISLLLDYRKLISK